MRIMLRNSAASFIKKVLPGHRLGVFFLLIVALSLRLVHLTRVLSGDELILYDISRLGIKDLLRVLTAKEVYPPLTYIFLHYWSFLGSSPAWIRLYFVFFGVGVCMLVFLIARDFLHEGAAKIALLLSAFSPLLIYSSQYVRSYGDSCFWMLLSVFFLLQIIKGKNGLIYWLGYFIACVAGIYTFYFSALLFFAQFIFMHIFYLRKKLIFKYYVALSLVVFAFLPWVKVAVRQFQNASSVAYDWSSIGFSLNGLRFGLYARNILGVFGMDPYFMVYGKGIGQHFSKATLIVAVGVCFISLFLIFIATIRFLNNKFPKNSPLVWFFPILIISPLLSAWVCAGLLNTLPAVKYFAFYNAIFLVFVSLIICSTFDNRRWLGFAFTLLIVAFYAYRLPQATAQEIEADKAASFLYETMSTEDAVICARSCPDREGGKQIIQLVSYLKLNKTGDSYEKLSREARDELSVKLSPFKAIFFYRAYGNVEIFGANRIVEDLLEHAGFRKSSLNKFNNIDVVKYEK